MDQRGGFSHTADADGLVGNFVRRIARSAARFTASELRRCNQRGPKYQCGAQCRLATNKSQNTRRLTQVQAVAHLHRHAPQTTTAETIWTRTAVQRIPTQLDQALPQPSATCLGSSLLEELPPELKRESAGHCHHQLRQIDRRSR